LLRTVAKSRPILCTGRLQARHSVKQEQSRLRE